MSLAGTEYTQPFFQCQGNKKKFWLISLKKLLKRQRVQDCDACKRGCHKLFSLRLQKEIACVRQMCPLYVPYRSHTASATLVLVPLQRQYRNLAEKFYEGSRRSLPDRCMMEIKT